MESGERSDRPGCSAYFEHDADFGVAGRGATVEEAFIQAAQAMFAIMVEPDKLRDDAQFAFEFEEPDLELALIVWLNRLLAEARRNGLALRRFALRRDGPRWLGAAWGQRWDDSLARGTEVKGATLTMLSVRLTAGQWEARCVVDV
ncbi:MAG: archease [Planctomycetota bacterium]